MAMEISRRTFIKGTAAAGVVLMSGAYLGCGNQNIPAQVRRGDVTYDVLIIGSGGAGMRAALAAAKDRNLKVAVMSKLMPTRSASTMAQGGMNGVTGVTDDKDSVESHTFDTIKGGDYLCDQDAVEYFAENAGKTIYEMDYMGYPYNRQKDGHFHQRKMGGSSHARASYFEDRAGHAMVHALFEQCLAHDVDFISECQMLEIAMTDADKLAGVIAMDMRSGDLIGIPAKTVLIATGGYGRAYWVRTSNPYSSTGDGIVAGMNAGVPFKDPEMVQFYPTGLSANGVLLSESSRSEGALLINKNGERFMARYAPEKMELATRDIVARAIATEIEEGRGIGEGLTAGVYLDFTKIPAERIRERLGQVADLSLRFAGVNITKAPVLISPTCHYSMGGLEMADFRTGATRVPGIFTAGEASCVSECNKNTLNADDFLDPFAFVKAEKLVADSRSKTPAEHLKAVLDAGLWRCFNCQECTAKCPKGLDPAGAIEKLKEKTFRHHLDDNVGARHAKAIYDDISESGTLDESKLNIKSEGYFMSALRLPMALRLMNTGKMDPLASHPVNPEIKTIAAIVKAAEQADKEEAKS